MTDVPLREIKIVGEVGMAPKEIFHMKGEFFSYHKAEKRFKLKSLEVLYTTSPSQIVSNRLPNMKPPRRRTKEFWKKD